jgi:O-acetyl-ADP-ribose deacetylase (regulator of RNase III)
VRLELGNGKLLEVVQGDITREATDAIVNAANSSLLGGGGVDGAIHRAGGRSILEECQRIRQTRHPGGLPTGQAVATAAGRLPARYVIHTVGPVWRGGGSREAELLASAYRESIRVAEELGLSSLAFPAISTGAYGFPAEPAAEIALRTAADELRQAQHLRLIKLVVFDAAALNIYRQELERFSRSEKIERTDRSIKNEN